MHTFTQIEKKILKAIRNQDVTDIKYLGTTIKDVFFPSRKCALYMEPSGKKVYLFFPSGQKHADRKCFAQLITLITFIEYLQKENLIYLQPTGMNHDVLFYENYQDSFLQGETHDSDVKHAISQQEFMRMDLAPAPEEISVTNDESVKAIKLQSDRLFITDAAGKRYLESTNVSSLYQQLYMLLCSRAFPTETLRRFISNGHCSDDEKRNKRSLCLSRASFLVALLALVLTSPWFATPYNNKKGYTTIEQHQFDTLKTILSQPVLSVHQAPVDSTKKDSKNNELNDKYKVKNKNTTNIAYPNP